MFTLLDLSNVYEKIIGFYTENFGILGGFILAFAENFFPPIPIVAIVLANISSFGTIIGFTITFTGHFLGAVCVFLFIRNILRPRIYKKLKPDSKFIKFENWFAKRQFHTLLVILSLPFVPYVFLNLAAGLSNISKRLYIVCLGIGNFLMTVFFTVVGVTFDNAIKSKDYVALVYPLILMLVAYLIGKFVENKFEIE